MGGKCGYVFKRNDPKTWGPDWEYWQKCHEEFEERNKLEKERDDIRETIQAHSERGKDTEEAEEEVESLEEEIRGLPSVDIPVLSDDDVFTERSTDCDGEVFTEEVWTCPHPEAQ